MEYIKERTSKAVPSYCETQSRVYTRVSNSIKFDRLNEEPFSITRSSNKYLEK